MRLNTALKIHQARVAAKVDLQPEMLPPFCRHRINGFIEDLDFCPAKGIDGLLAVADEEKRPVAPGAGVGKGIETKSINDAPLEVIRVLKLIHQKVPVAFLDAPSDVGRLQQLTRPQLQVLEIERRRFAFGLGVEKLHAPQHLEDNLLIRLCADIEIDGFELSPALAAGSERLLQRFDRLAHIAARSRQGFAQPRQRRQKRRQPVH